MSNTKKVNSTAVRAFEYDRDRNDLKITFISGKSYIYTPVSNEFYRKFRTSGSKGKFFNENIKENEAFTCLKLIK